jgi:ABC-type glycerol-3-phosphate transport system permease component
MMKTRLFVHKPLVALVVIIVTILILFPLYWMLSTSLKYESEVFRLPPTLFPDTITTENFIFAWTETSMPTYFMNSAIYVVGTLLVVLLCACLASYSISRFKFKGKAVFLLLVLLTQLMPITTLIVPLFVSLGNLDMMNSRLSMIIIYAAIQIPIAIWLLLGYFNSIPREIDEAARIDGSSNIGILFRIILPLAKPGLMAVSLTITIFVWQDLILAMTFTSIDSLRPVMAGVSASIQRAGIRWGQMTATGVLACIPIMVIYIFLQRNLVEGLTGGAVKG